MKKIYLLFVLSVLCMSCSDDFISKNPPSDLNSEGFYKTETDMNQAVLSAYANLRSLYNQTYVRLGEIRSDNTTYSWLSGNPANEKGIDEFSSPLLPENNFLASCWDDSYKTILRCNIVIGRIENIEFKSEVLKAQYTAEARFLRALIYFYLNRIFGGYGVNGELLGAIKVDREITQTEAYDMGRVSLQEMYDLIIQDLKYAESNLPESYGSTDIGRVTKGGATALLGKVYMTMAGYPLNKGEEYYKLAIDQFKSVIGNSRYSLVPTYKDLFEVSNKNTSESLFEVQYKKGTQGGATGSPWNNNFAPRFSDKEVVLVEIKVVKIPLRKICPMLMKWVIRVNTFPCVTVGRMRRRELGKMKNMSANIMMFQQAVRTTITTGSNCGWLIFIFYMPKHLFVRMVINRLLLTM